MKEPFFQGHNTVKKIALRYSYLNILLQYNTPRYYKNLTKITNLGNNTINS